MNTPTFIPGPWMIGECHEPGTFNQSYFIHANEPPLHEEEPTVICRLPTGMGKFSKQWPNAVLIAAAPELLEALRVMLEPYETTTSKLFVPETARRLDTARAAIAKATGSGVSS